MKTIAILNTKGGASKSTVALQVAAAYFLQRNEAVNLYEFDDENKDSLSFDQSQIKTKQIKIGDGKDISDILRENLLNNNKENLILDVGGNKTTTTFVSGLKKSSIYNMIDLIIIPMSGGNQDAKNAVKTYELVKEFNKPVIFALSRVTNTTRIHWKYRDYFLNFPNEKYIVLRESDVIELSRQNSKSVYEIAIDNIYIELLEKSVVDAFEKQDWNKAKELSTKKEISLEAIEYLNDTLLPAWQVLGSVIGEENVIDDN